MLQAGGSGQELCGGREDGGCAAETQARRLCCAQVHMFCCALALTFVAMPFPAWTALWAGSLFIYYSLTAYGAPEHTGASRVPASRSRERRPPSVLPGTRCAGATNCGLEQSLLCSQRLTLKRSEARRPAPPTTAAACDP